MVNAIIKANNNLNESSDNKDWEMMGQDIKKLQELITSLENAKKEEENKKEKENINNNEDKNTIDENTIDDDSSNLTINENAG